MPTTTYPLLLPAVDPAPVEAQAAATGQALYDALLPLHLYCEQQRARADLTPWQFEHLRQIEAMLDALAADKNQTAQLLTVLRANVEGLNSSLHRAGERGEVPAWTLNPHPTPAELLAEREADPVYRLGYGRGYRQGQQMYQRLASLYAQYAILVPPPGYTPPPLVAQVQATYAYQLNLPRLDYPLEACQDLSAIDHTHLPKPRHAA